MRRPNQLCHSEPRSGEESVVVSIAGESSDDGLCFPMLYPGWATWFRNHGGIRTRDFRINRSNPRLHHRRNWHI